MPPLEMGAGVPATPAMACLALVCHPLELIQPVFGFIPSQTSQQIGVRQALQVITKAFVVVDAALVFSPVMLEHKLAHSLAIHLSLLAWFDPRFLG